MLGGAQGLGRVPPACNLSLRFLQPGETGSDFTRPFLCSPFIGVTHRPSMGKKSLRLIQPEARGTFIPEVESWLIPCPPPLFWG